MKNLSAKLSKNLPTRLNKVFNNIFVEKESGILIDASCSAPGRVIEVFGPSGVGKSTLLNSLERVHPGWRFLKFKKPCFNGKALEGGLGVGCVDGDAYRALRRLQALNQLDVLPKYDVPDLERLRTLSEQRVLNDVYLRNLKGKHRNLVIDEGVLHYYRDQIDRDIVNGTDFYLKKLISSRLAVLITAPAEFILKNRHSKKQKSKRQYLYTENLMSIESIRSDIERCDRLTNRIAFCGAQVVTLDLSKNPDGLGELMMNYYSSRLGM